MARRSQERGLVRGLTDSARSSSCTVPAINIIFLQTDLTFALGFGGLFSGILKMGGGLLKIILWGLL